jgi:hypothetical protein
MPVMVPSTDQKLILKFTMLYVDNINVVLCNVISNFQSDLICSIKLKVPRKNKHMHLNTKKKLKSRFYNTKFLKQTIWMTTITLGMSIA